MSSSEEDSYSMVFTSLKHPIRRKILRILSSEETSFSDLQKQFKIESSHLTYHIDGLGNLLYKTAEGKYALSSLGEAAASMMKNVEEPSKPSMHSVPKSIGGMSALKLLSLILVCGLIASLIFNGLTLLRYNDLASSNNELSRAYSDLTNKYNQLNQSYDELNRAYTELNQTYFSSVPHTLAFETIAHGLPIEETLTYHVAQNESSLIEIWNRIFLPIPVVELCYIGFNIYYPPLPNIDFSESTVIAVLGGQYSNISYTVRITEVLDFGQYVIVKFEKIYPNNTTIPLLVGSAHVVKTQKINKPILFYVTERTMD